MLRATGILSTGRTCDECLPGGCLVRRRCRTGDLGHGDLAWGSGQSGLWAAAIGLRGRSRAFRVGGGERRTVFGGATFLVCVALGLGSLLFPLSVQLPRGFLLLFAASPVLAGLSLIAPVTPRWSGGVLLIAFISALAYLVWASHGQTFLQSEEVAEAREKPLSVWLAGVLILVGIVLISAGGELVARGALGLVAGLGIPAAVMGMVIAPAAIEIEEVFRQAVPSREGRHDVSAGNLVGTLLYFVLCNLGLITLFTPVPVSAHVRWLDWPTLMVVTWIATFFLWRGRVGRWNGALLLSLYAAYAALQILVH